MKKIAIAEIYWYKKTIINYGAERISPILKIDDSNKNNDIFSSIILNKKFIDNNTTISYISFVAESAQYNLINEDKTFSLYDGNIKIGYGVIKKVILDEFINDSGKWSIKKDILQ